MISMLGYKIIFFVSAIVWAITPIKQFRSYFFWYFLLLGPLDIVSLFLSRCFGLQLLQVYVLFSCFFPIVLLTSKLSEKKNILLILAVSISSISGFMFPNQYGNIHLEIIVFIVFILITKRTLVFTAQTGKINFFHMVFILYQVSLFLKIFLTFSHVGIGLIYYAASNIFEILIGIFFIFYREDSPGLIINLRKEVGIS
jgi:hypothetical protein